MARLGLDTHPTNGQISVQGLFIGCNTLIYICTPHHISTAKLDPEFVKIKLKKMVKIWSKKKKA